MKIGYPCINRRIGCRSDGRFRISSYSDKTLSNTVSNNLECLKKILQFNINHKILFFRISSDTIPLASHPICKFNWRHYFKEQLLGIGKIIKEYDVRISMHPGQYVVLNSKKQDTILNSIRELEYHKNLLNQMGLDNTAKIQIHVGGVYGDKEDAMKRFIDSYETLEDNIKKRLVIEHDERSYSLKDCIWISKEIQIPVVFDILHHKYHNQNETITEAIQLAGESWKKIDGLQMIDYSNIEEGSKPGKHSNNLNLEIFQEFLIETKHLDFDIMLEIKDKENSALEAVQILSRLGRL
ncbi:MAG: UV DNA damage repair endonuclease UvsE [Candidatus Heimdallarchaeaceae archaeon]